MKKIIKKKGFTLAELIIVIAIMAIISTLSLYNSGKLNSSILLSNTAYEISLIVRDAQVSGLGAKVISSKDGSGNATTSNQGVFFDILKPEEVVLFADLDKSNSYGVGEESQIYNIQNKRAGKILRVYKIDTTQTPAVAVDISRLNIIFKRPNPEAYIYIAEAATPDSMSEYVGSVGINMGFDNGDCRSVIVYKTGAIQIDKSFCN